MGNLKHAHLSPNFYTMGLNITKFDLRAPPPGFKTKQHIRYLLEHFTKIVIDFNSNFMNVPCNFFSFTTKFVSLLFIFYHASCV